MFPDNMNGATIANQCYTTASIVQLCINCTNSVSFFGIDLYSEIDVMTATAATRMPLHLQISAMLANEIQSGLLTDGEKLAPERQMAAHLNISVGTLRKALFDLEEKGMLNRVHGSGNYVHHSVEAENIYALFRLELIEGNGDPTAKLLSIDKLAKTDDMPEFGESDQAYRFRRLRMIGDVPAALEEIWLAASYAPTIDESAVADSMYLFYKEQLGFWITRAEDRVSVAQLPEWGPANWSENDISCCGFVERLSRDQKGQVAEFSRTWFDPNTVRFVSRS